MQSQGRRVGVVTLSNTKDNYGQVLQYWALDRYLKQEGHSPFLMRLLGGKRELRHKLRELYANPLTYVANHNPYTKMRRLLDFEKRRNRKSLRKQRKISADVDALHPLGFEDFRRRHFEIVEVKTLLDAPVADIYMSGSDQIWSGYSDFNFLNFGGKGVKRISYSSSFGGAEIGKRFMRRLRRRLREFDAISVREYSGVAVCERAGRVDAECVVDPTFLLDRGDYELLAGGDSIVEGDYIFVYLLGNQIDVTIEQIQDWVSRRADGLRVVYVANQGRIDGYDKFYPRVEEWVNLIANAKYVLTNSFHGAALSVILERQFLAFPLVGERAYMNERIETLSRRYSLDKRIYRGDLDALLAPIDYAQVNKSVEQSRHAARSFLQRSL